MAMELTPTAKSSFLAGLALSLVAWLTLFKLDQVPVIKRWYDKERVFTWINGHKSLSLIFTEIINFGVHGITQSTAVTFALGATVMNALMIFVLLPLRAMRKKPDEVSRILAGHRATARNRRAA